MSGQRKCPNCGRPVPISSLADNCPACLLQLALAAGPSPIGSDQGSAPNLTGEVAAGVLRYFGDYELQSEIARGGMGVVYRARQVSLDRTVALKMILAGQLATPSQVQRFRLEAEAAAKLDHPNIVPIFEIGEHEGQHYYSMKLIGGRNLAGWAGEGRAETDAGGRKAARLVAAVARAVHYAHQRGILHRDLKPTNILLDARGEPHVTDFGLAKLTNENSDMTGTAAVLGTPGYMAPEQAGGEARQATTATDVYGLGAILYELLTGRPPFRGETPLQTMRQLLEEEPVPPNQLLREAQIGNSAASGQRSKIHADLETICLKCLHKDPAARYGSAAALAEDLEHWLAGRPISARPMGVFERLWSRTKRDPKLAGLTASVIVLLLAITIGSVTAVVRIARAGARARRAEQKATEELLAAYLAQARAERRSGRAGQRFDTLAAVAHAAAIKPSLELRNEAIAAMALTDIRFTNAWQIKLDRQVRYSRDMQFYAFTDAQGMVNVCRTMGNETAARFPQVGAGTGWIFDFSPDDHYLDVRYRDGGHCVWDVTARRAILGPVAGEAGAFSPDGKDFWLSESNGNLGVYDLPSATVRRALHAGASFQRVIFEPHSGLFAGFSLDSPTLVVSRMDSAEQIRTLTNPAPLEAIDWSADGKFLAGGCADGQIVIWDAASGQKRAVLTGHEVAVISVGFSHAGDLLATSSWDGTFRIWDVAAARPLVVTFGAGYQAVFGPDDNQIAYNRRGWEVRTVEVTRPAELRQLRCENESAPVPWNVDITSDGKLAAVCEGPAIRLWDFVHGRQLALRPDPGCQSAILTAGGRELITSGVGGLARWPVRLRQSDGTNAVEVGPREALSDNIRFGFCALNRQGHWLAAANQDANYLEVYDLEHPANHFALGRQPGITYVSCSPDGRWLASGTWHGKGVQIWNVAERRLVCELPGNGPTSVAFSPDNTTLVTGGESYLVVETGSWRELYRIAKTDSDKVGVEAFSPDGRYLAVVLEGNIVRLLCAADGRVLADFEAPGQPLISDLRFSADGAELATLLSNRNLQVWDLRRIRRELATMNLDWGAEEPEQAQISPTGAD
jgi:eukaryotic-like serine/threonine-protein kinase